MGFVTEPLYAIFKRDLLKGRTQFWVNVYAKYNRKDYIIHDKKRPYIVFRVMHFSYLDNLDISQNKKDKILRQRLNEIKQYYGLLVNRVLTKFCSGKGSTDWEEKKILRLYGYYLGREKFEESCDSQIKIRSQQGMRDNFIDAIKRSGRFMDKMEIIFQKYRVPIAITRLPFVESMFNIRAASPVGAAGLWQFMKATGKRYLTINQWFDERQSPIKATFAAARLMRYNFEETGSWPVAITAYNHGLNGMKKAIKQLGTRDLSVILENYRSGSFGFDSKNFFAGFAAARHVYDSRKHYFGEITAEPSIRFKLISIEKPLRVKSLVKMAGVDWEKFKELNPDILNEAYYRDIKIPKNYIILLPRANFVRFNLAYDQYMGRKR